MKFKSKFDDLYNKIISESVDAKAKKILIKEDPDFNTEQTDNQQYFQVFYDTLMTDILDLCENVKEWKREGQDYNQIAKDFITDCFMEFGDEIIADLFDNVITEQEFEAADFDQQNEWMKKAINDGGWISQINDLAFGYADNYTFPLTNVEDPATTTEPDEQKI